MGQDVTPSSLPPMKAKPNGASQDREHSTIDDMYSKSSTERSEQTVASDKEGMADVAPDESCNAVHDILEVKSTNLEGLKNAANSSKVEEAKSSTPDKSILETPLVENVETKHIVQNSSDVATDQHACASPVPAETPANKSLSINNLQSSSSSKKSQSNSSCVSRKRLDDEDDWSTASSTTASVRTVRTRTTMPVAPKFTVSERLEKRKEFYSKLDEKHKALEVEKREYEARNKEEQQAAIKQLRKTMVYKANPVPSFYYEGPPPKKEIKKAPTTRAVSPKLGRRKSCGDTGTSTSAEKVVCARTHRHSLGGRDQNHKQNSSTPTSTPKKKGVIHEPSSKGSLRKDRPKQLPKEPSPAREPTQGRALAPEPSPESQDVTQQKMANLSVQS